jgi:hypothetical protein
MTSAQWVLERFLAIVAISPPISGHDVIKFLTPPRQQAKHSD